MVLNWSLSQTTSITDSNFEQKLIDLGIDNVLDGTVLTTNINSVTNLNVSFSNINDLTGIEGFTSLDSLFCYNNQLVSIDLSQNTALTYLFCENNNLTSIDLSQNTALSTLYCQNNNLIFIDVSQNNALSKFHCYNNQLSNLDLSQNFALTQLSVYNNQLTNLNLTQNIALTDFGCMNNQLQCLNVKNGANSNIVSFSSVGNPSLTCIEVDNVAWSSTNWSVGGGNIDATSSFSTNCPNSCSLGVFELNNTSTHLLKIVDFMGRETEDKPNTLLIYIYSDGTSAKVFRAE